MEKLFFSPNKIRDLVKAQMGRQISQDFLFSLINHLEEHAKELIQKSETELEKLNNNYEKHGLRKKERLSSQHLRLVLEKTKYSPSYLKTERNEYSKQQSETREEKSEPN